VHEILVSEEECHRTVDRGDFYAIAPVLPELRNGDKLVPAFIGEYSSGCNVMSYEQVVDLLHQQKLMIGEIALENQELLR
ncbi:MAG TPA: hypothetical protein VFF68_07960, partial [Anaerolineaceae bacterium]|nr:hypothetical protein [Anaerolineaceae bacterium]